MHSKRTAAFSVVTAGEVDASTFRLINTNNPNAAVGDVLGEYIDQSTVIPDYSSIELHHTPPGGPSSSGLYWSINGAMIEETTLRGPTNQLTPAVSPPSLGLWTDYAQDRNSFALGTGAAANGDNASLSGFVDMLASSGNLHVEAADGTGTARAGIDLNYPNANRGNLDLIVAGSNANSGLTLNGRRARLLVAEGQADATANLVLAAGYVLVPGCAVVLNGLLANDVAHIHGAFDFRNAGAISFGAGACFVNGGALAGNPSHQIGAGGGSTVGRSWRYVIPANGNYTFDLRAAQTGGVWTAFTPTTAILVQVFGHM